MTAQLNSMTQQEKTLSFWWIIATIVGWIIGFTLCEAIDEAIRNFTCSPDGAVIGISIGIMQWLVLRRFIKPIGWWIIGSIVAFAIGKFISDMIEASWGTLGLPIAGTVIGLSIGVIQYLILLHKIPWPKWWILANTVAWAAGWSIMRGIETVGELPLSNMYFISSIGAALVGIITAICLIWMFRQRPLQHVAT
jgi:hypothetical protein